MESKIYIVGAHPRGRTFKEYITFLYPETSIESFLVDDLSENDREIDGIPVRAISSESNLNAEYPVYLATRGIYHDKLTQELQALGMKYIYPVDVALDSRLRNEYVRRVYEQTNRSFVCIDDNIPRQELSATIYVATSVNDKELQKEYEQNPYERVIQVGAALTGQRLERAVVFDDTGENISSKNRQYCELTALYWIWKNAQQDVVGLVHYRRHFILPYNWLDWMKYNHVDVLLPVPLYVAPSIEENYKGRHDPSDWECMMEYLKENCPSDYEKAQKVFQGNLYSPCNMFIMRKEVLDALCGWMFPILDAVVEHGGSKEDTYRNRYPGFLSERLITYYFEAHRDAYKVVYANKNFLQ